MLRVAIRIVSLVGCLALAASLLAQSSRVLTNADIIQMTSAKLSEQVILNSIQTSPNNKFDVSPGGLIALKQAGISDAVIAAMQKAGATRGRGSAATVSGSGNGAVKKPSPLPSPLPAQQPCDIANGCPEATFKAPPRPPERLDSKVYPDSRVMLRYGREVVWIEWLTRSERGGSFLRALNGTIGDQKEGYEIAQDTKFVFKAPDDSARVYIARQDFRVPTNRKESAAIARAVQEHSSPLNEPAPSWTGEIVMSFNNRQEIKKDWSDGPLVEVDWALGYIRLVSGRMQPTNDGVNGFGSLYEIFAGSVIDVELAGMAEKQRHTVAKDFFISKNTAPRIGLIQTFVTDGHGSKSR